MRELLPAPNCTADLPQSTAVKYVSCGSVANRYEKNRGKTVGKRQRN